LSNIKIILELNAVLGLDNKEGFKLPFLPLTEIVPLPWLYLVWAKGDI